MMRQMPANRIWGSTIRFMFLIVGLLCLSSCTQNTQEPAATTKPRPEPTLAAATQSPQQEDTMEGNLIAWVDDRAQAEEIATLYGIDLIRYSDYIALYHTDQDPNDVIKLGKANGWPELSRNDVVTIDH